MINLGIKSRIILYAVLSWLMFSCRPKYEPGPCFETFNDFENTKGWVDNSCNNAFSITNEFGYNSESCVHISSKSPFGYMFRLKFCDINNPPPSSIDVEFTTKLNSNTSDSCKLVCTIEDQNNQIVFWTEENLEELTDKTEWKVYRKKINFNGFNNADNKVNVFFWNHDSKQEIFVDNMSIKFYNTF